MTDAIRPPFPLVIDNSLLSAFRACPEKCRLEYFEHWKPKVPSVHLHAGGAWARGMEVTREKFFGEGLSSMDAKVAGLEAMIKFYGDFECPPDSAKSIERLCGAFEYAFDVYPLETEPAKPAMLPGGRLGIEFSFAEPMDETHPVTGEPLLYCGRFDQIVDFQSGVWGFDDKTTSQLGPSWSKSWDLRSQFTGYAWGARRVGVPIEGFLVRGISILKTKYDTLQAITYRPQWMVDEWYEQMQRDVRRLKQAWLSGYFDKNFDEACTSFGGCMFRQICLSSADNRASWLETSFERRRWDPVIRIETAV